jgi:GNAT superfamily N-acetyltransferase
MMWHVRQADIADAAFLTAGNLAMARETEELALDAERLRAGVEAVLRDPARGFYLIAEDSDGRAAGHLMITFEWSDWRNAWWFWVQSVYVFPHARRQGVYRALHAAVVERAAAHHEPVRGVRLYVERDNSAAQSTYAGVGMREAVYRMFEQDLRPTD